MQLPSCNSPAHSTGSSTASGLHPPPQIHPLLQPPGLHTDCSVKQVTNHHTIAECLQELVICDIDFEEESEDHQPATVTTAAAARQGSRLRAPSGSSTCSGSWSVNSGSNGGSSGGSSGGCQPLSPEQQRQLVQLVWGEAGVQPEAAWQQGFVWNSTPGLEWGLVQLSGMQLGNHHLRLASCSFHASVHTCAARCGCPLVTQACCCQDEASYGCAAVRFTRSWGLCTGMQWGACLLVGQASLCNLDSQPPPMWAAHLGWSGALRNCQVRNERSVAPVASVPVCRGAAMCVCGSNMARQPRRAVEGSVLCMMAH